jgi:hypothetical protein
MDVIDAQRFLSSAGKLGIAPDERYAHPQCLTYVPHRGHYRFWNVPQRATAIPFFVSHLLAGLERWEECYLWPRGGRWPRSREHRVIMDDVRGMILGGAGIAAGFEGAARFGADELDRLVTAVFAQVPFGRCVSDDLFLVPDHGRCFLWTDHHDVVHVQFSDEKDVEPFIRHMAAKNFALPADVPDGTFKRPDWMR